MNITSLQFWNLIKRRFGIPYTFFELSYDEVMQIVKEKTMRLFSQYVPRRVYVPFKANEARIQDGVGEYRIPYDGEIISVIDFYTGNNDVIVGYPISIISTEISDSTDTFVQMMQSMPNINASSAVFKTWEFLEPNIIKVIPGSFGFDIGLVYMEVLHKDLSTIPGRFAHDFIDLALADIYDTLADIRSKYQQIMSPFGDIQLNPDIMRSQAENLRAKVYERLISLPPNVIVKGQN